MISAKTLNEIKDDIKKISDAELILSSALKLCKTISNSKTKCSIYTDLLYKVIDTIEPMCYSNSNDIISVVRKLKDNGEQNGI